MHANKLPHQIKWRWTVECVSVGATLEYLSCVVTKLIVELAIENRTSRVYEPYALTFLIGHLYLSGTWLGVAKNK